jgi:hypothetical protein
VLRLRKLLPLFAIAGCTSNVDITEDEGSTSGASINYTSHLTGCHGQASSSIPASGNYVLTSFGGPGDEQPMSCGGQADGKGWYAASRQRYGCGAKLMVQANGKCVVLAALDYGPDVCVENAAHSPILDVSTAASKLLFGTSSAGWSDHFVVNAVQVASSTPLGPCEPGGDTGGGSGSGTGSGGGSTMGAACSSATLGRDVDAGTCVQSATDALWYQCNDGNWDEIPNDNACAVSFGYCNSASLGRDVPARTCVQSASSGTWFQCNGSAWVTPVNTSTRTGALGACSTWNPR